MAPVVFCVVSLHGLELNALQNYPRLPYIHTYSTDNQYTVIDFFLLSPIHSYRIIYLNKKNQKGGVLCVHFMTTGTGVLHLQVQVLHRSI